LTHETRKLVLIRLGAVCAAVALAWVFAVKPRLAAAHGMGAIVAAQDEMIERHARLDDTPEARALLVAASRLRAADKRIAARLTPGGTSDLLHTIVNDAASALGLTVAGMETIASRPIDQEIPIDPNAPIDQGTKDGADAVTGETHSVRVELTGAFDAAVRFVHAIQRHDQEIRFKTLRLRPLGGVVRVRAELTLTTLTEVPGLTERDQARDEHSAGDQSGGEQSGEPGADDD